MADGDINDIVLCGGVCNNSYFVERLMIKLEKSLDVNVEKIKTIDILGWTVNYCINYSTTTKNLCDQI